MAEWSRLKPPSPKKHVMTREYLERLQAERLIAGLPPLTPEQLAAECNHNPQRRHIRRAEDLSRESHHG